MSCPDCFKGGVATGTPSGTTSTLHGVKTYIATPKVSAPSPSPSTSTIILYTDAFGHLLPNNLLLADALAQLTHLTVLVPDIIPGGGMSPAILPLMDTFTSPDTNALSKTWAMARAMVYVLPFFARASPQSENCTVPCEEFARAVRSQMRDGGKLGVAGYCWGGFQALRIAGVNAGGDGEGGVVAREEEGRIGDAVFVAHPARFEASHAVGAVQRGAKVSFAHAGEDMSLKMALVEETEKALQGNGAFELKVYEGCVHGFAVRATPGKEKEATAAGEALKQAVDWFGKWL